MIFLYSRLATIIAGFSTTHGILDFERINLIIQGLLFVTIFGLACGYYFYTYHWSNLEARRIFYFTFGMLGLLVIGKYALFHFRVGYIADRLPFYALPSPKAQNFLWFIFPILVFTLFMVVRERLERLALHTFLAALAAFSSIFTLAVAGMRQGVASIIDPFTRTYWEYTGNLHLITNLKDFLHNYVSLLPQLAAHTSTHPPGYTVILYIFQELFTGNLLALTIALAVTVSAIVWPLFYLWRSLLDEVRARQLVETFIFIPSVVLFTATSMDAFFMLVVWLAIAACYVGWRQSNWLSLVAGLMAAVGLFSNFLFLLLGPLFIFLAIQSLWRIPATERNKRLSRVGLSAVVMLLFFVLLHAWSGYSLWQNFVAAKAANNIAVQSNFVSVVHFFLYAFITLSDFFIYLGPPLAYLIVRHGRKLWSQGPGFIKLGAVMTAYLSLVGVFQGETGRLWLFMTPFYALAGTSLLGEADKKIRSAFLACSFAYLIIIETLFYTYW